MISMIEKWQQNVFLPSFTSMLNGVLQGCPKSQLRTVEKITRRAMKLGYGRYWWRFTPVGIQLSMMTKIIGQWGIWLTPIRITVRSGNDLQQWESRNLDKIAEQSQILVYTLFWPFDHTITSDLIISFAFRPTRPGKRIILDSCETQEHNWGRAVLGVHQR